jgi:hypothetical protein
MDGRRNDKQEKMWMEAIMDILKQNYSYFPEGSRKESLKTSAKITRFGLKILSQYLRI